MVKYGNDRAKGLIMKLYGEQDTFGLPYLIVHGGFVDLVINKYMFVCAVFYSGHNYIMLINK